MDKKTISLIGIIDTLKHLLDTDKKARKNPDAVAASQRLENIRQKLLIEGLRHSQIHGAARDAIFEVSTQLEAHLSKQNAGRDLQWVINGLLTGDIQDIQPPNLPSSSVSGPQSVAVEVVQLAEALVEITANRSKANETVATPMVITRQTMPVRKSSNERLRKG